MITHKRFIRSHCFLILAAILVFFLIGLVVSSHAATIEIFAGDSFEAAVEHLNAGDILIVHEGTYLDAGKISIQVKGSETLPVIIKGVDNESAPLISRSSDASVENTINIEGASYLTIKGLEVTSNGGDGINLSGIPYYITLENLHIYSIDVGINFRSDMHHITVKNNHIHHTGMDGGTGEGMYVGCNFAECIVSNSLIKGNWIHDTHEASQGDGIEIKAGSHSNMILDNVIHDTKYPCILLYGTNGNPRNLVEGNAIWNCGDSGIQAAADIIIRNNIVLDSPDNAFNSQDHQGVTPSNIEFVHNTIVGGNPCLRLHNWSNKQDMLFANNAVYCESGNFQISGMDGVIVSGNVIYQKNSLLQFKNNSKGRCRT